MKNVEISTTNSTVGNLKFDSFFAANWLFDVPDIDMPVALGILNDCFHRNLFTLVEPLGPAPTNDVAFQHA